MYCTIGQGNVFLYTSGVIGDDMRNVDMCTMKLGPEDAKKREGNTNKKLQLRYK